MKLRGFVMHMELRSLKMQLNLSEQHIKENRLAYSETSMQFRITATK